MEKKQILKMLSILVILLLLIPTIMPSVSSGSILKTIKKPTIKVAFIWQRWDTLDIPAVLIMEIYKRHLEKAEKIYNVHFKVYTFWDNKQGGDVQDGKLRKLSIDVIVGPGGFGGFNSPEKYRDEIRKFVRMGGGFYGICGDSTFGSLGIIHLPRGYKLLLRRHVGIKEFTPMLGIANVYTDATVFSHILKNPVFYGKWDMIKTVSSLFTSRAPIYITPCSLDIQKPHFRDRVRVMMGNAPLVDGPALKRLTMSKVTTLAVFRDGDDPYDRSIRGEKAIIATTYGRGRVILSTPHPELTIGKTVAHDLFVRNILWCARELPGTSNITP